MQFSTRLMQCIYVKSFGARTLIRSSLNVRIFMYQIEIGDRLIKSQTVGDLEMIYMDLSHITKHL